MVANFRELDPALELLEQRMAPSKSQVFPPIAPDFLVHYTSAGGLAGILEHGKFWATNYRFLNDPSEVQLAADLLETVLTNRLEAARTEIAKEMLRRSLTQTNHFDGMYDCFIVCFCEHDDVLNQWRVYSSNGGGFAATFAPRQFVLQRNPHHAGTFFLCKVVYDSDIQRRLIEEIVDGTVEVLEENARGRSVAHYNHQIARSVGFLREQVTPYLIAFKHHAYAVESEWRICYVPSREEEKDLKFREGQFGLTPFMEIEPRLLRMPGSLPLTKVTFGPCREPKITQYALNKLLRRWGYPMADMQPSSLPIRLGN